MFDARKDINIIVSTEDGFGYGSVYSSADGYIYAKMFNETLNQDILDKGGSFSEVISELKPDINLVKKSRTVFQSVNEILSFYRIHEISNTNDVPDSTTVCDIQEAIDMLVSESKAYLLFQLT